MKRWKYWRVFLRDLYFRKKQPSFMLGSRTGKSISLKKASHVLLFYTMENK